MQEVAVVSVNKLLKLLEFYNLDNVNRMLIMRKFMPIYMYTPPMFNVPIVKKVNENGTIIYDRVDLDKPVLHMNSPITLEEEQEQETKCS